MVTFSSLFHLTEKYGRSILSVMGIEHLIVPVRDYDRGKRFYERAVRPLGLVLLLDWPDRRRVYFGLEGEPSSLWVVESEAAGSLLRIGGRRRPSRRGLPRRLGGLRRPVGRRAGHPARLRPRVLRGAGARPRRQRDRSRPPNRGRGERLRRGLAWPPSYSQLDAATAHRLQVARGPRVGAGAFRTFASSFLSELGPECPAPIRGEDWSF